MLRRYFAPDLFAGRTVFVTGGGGTINVGIARGLGELGGRVVLAGRTMERLDACRDELRAAGIEDGTITGYRITRIRDFEDNPGTGGTTITE